HPEEGIDLAILERVHRLGDAEPLALHVTVLVEARRFDDAEPHHLGRAARRTGRDAFAPEGRHLRAAYAVDRDHVHAIGVPDHQGAQGHLRALELVLAAVRVLAGVRPAQPDVGLAGRYELEVV